MKERTLTALAIIAGVIPLFFSEEYLYLLVLMISFAIALELNDLISDNKYPLIVGLTFAMITSIGLDFIASGDKLMVIMIFLIIFVLFDLVYNEIGFNNLSILYSVSLLVGFAMNAFISLYAMSTLFVWYILIVTYGSDTGAYLIGSRFGKNKLIPKISPNKTVEGAIGGVVVGGTLGLSFALLTLQTDNILLLVLISYGIPMLAQLGDLFFSSLKRLFNKKDFGTLFPGHGGVLDRIDSLIFSLVFIVIFLRIGYISFFI
ncbi:MAG: phosphatidate cytidylyltransferase [Erysipelothrix sp.]|nr:phosphatidate cytidylyltransferase [Erysipelothrix sp.]